MALSLNLKLAKDAIFGFSFNHHDFALLLHFYHCAFESKYFANKTTAMEQSIVVEIPFYYLLINSLKDQIIYLRKIANKNFK